jgi:hypothetical protein
MTRPYTAIKKVPSQLKCSPNICVDYVRVCRREDDELGSRHLNQLYRGIITYLLVGETTTHRGD